MHKNVYTFLIFFLKLTIAYGFCQSYIRFDTGVGVYIPESIILWVIRVGIIFSLVSAIRNGNRQRQHFFLFIRLNRYKPIYLLCLDNPSV